MRLIAVLAALVLAVSAPAFAQPALRTEPVAAFPGAVFASTPGVRRPALIVLGGSEGGAETAKRFAPMLAKLGYSVLGLPYYSPAYDPSAKIEGLPTAFSDIPVDRLQAAREWLATRPEVDADRIGVWGASKGAEFALIAATRFPWIKAVVAVVPSDVVWEGWGVWTAKEGTLSSFAWKGKSLPFVPYDDIMAEFAKAQRGEQMSLLGPHVRGRALHPDLVAKAKIPVEQYRGALLLIAGELDQEWPSAEMARAVAARRTAAGLRTEVVVYPDAGHALAGDGSTVSPRASQLGGTVEAISRDQRDAWARTTAFLKAALDPR